MIGDAHQPLDPNPTGSRLNGAARQHNVSQIIEALEAVHGAHSSNETRRQASSFLEEAKTNDEAPYHGFSLASDRSQPPVVRHFALSLLEYAIRHRWVDYTEAQALALRQWVTSLAQLVEANDPPYLRNKIAQLWIEVAKRSWANEWLDMDEELVRLWTRDETTDTYKILVAEVLEGLSEDIFNREDATATLRGSTLSKACVDIFTPAVVLQEQFPNRNSSRRVRCGDEGWMVRLAEFLFKWTEHPVEDQTCAIKVIATLKAALNWAIPKAIVASRCVPSICRCLALPNVTMQMASIEALHTLYSRSQYNDDEFITLVCPLYDADSVALLKKIYEWSITDAADIDQDKYQLAKKFSEVRKSSLMAMAMTHADMRFNQMLSNLGNFVEERPTLIPGNCDLPGFLQLLLLIFSSDSLTISIPVLNTWVRLLKSDVIGGSEELSPLIGPLLETCSQRLIRYESLPDDSEDPSILFLNEDIDTIPERHAFLGNYRRYCVEVVEIVVRRKPFEALYHILGQVDQSLQTLYQQQPGFNAETYSKSSISLLRVDAHFTVVEAALRGYMRWVHSHGSRPQQDELERGRMEANLESWCERLMEMGFEDPVIRRRILQVGVAFSTSALDKKAAFMLKVMKHILITRPVEIPAYAAYSEAVRDLQQDCTHELQRLAIKMPDYLMTVYDDLEAKIKEIISNDVLDERQRISFYSFLFIINHRSTTIDPQLRNLRLQSYVNPIIAAWQTLRASQSLTSFEEFSKLIGLGRVQQYLISRQTDQIKDWSSHPLDDEGKAIQAEISEKFRHLPLRSTKGFLGVSFIKLKKGSPEYRIATDLWRDALPIILPSLLELMSFSHAYYDPENWTGLPPNLRSLVGRTLTDRFWQAGISSGSKDAFLARLSGTKATLEGFASSVRGAIRTVREFCYNIIFGLSRLDSHFYGFQELPGPLSKALFADARSMSSHQLSTMLNMVRCLIDDCPPEMREHFLPPILSCLFTAVDGKITGEWENISRKAQASTEDENLSDEMKEESILRQLTYTSVLMVAGLLDPHRENPHITINPSMSGKFPAVLANGPNPPSDFTQPNTLRSLILTTPELLQPLLMFLTHATSYRDTRSTGITLRVLRSILPDFTSPTSQLQLSVREHIASTILTNIITALHEPYFVDLQRDLAQLIAGIYLAYEKLEGTPGRVLASLQGVGEERVRRMGERMLSDNDSSGGGGGGGGGADGEGAVGLRQQRALILDLLAGVRGRAVGEMGRLPVRAAGTRDEVPNGHGDASGGKKQRERSGMMAEFVKSADGSAPGATSTTRRDVSVDLDGIGEMFG